MNVNLLTLENVCKYYTSKQSVVMGLTNINISFNRGEFVAITGESGSGKSTLAHVLGGILPYESGELLFEGRPTSHFDGTDYENYRRDHISFISQNYDILPGTSVLENVVSALRLSGLTKEDALWRAEEILQEVELWQLRRRRAAKLSSGQKQRLSIARALAKPAPILIADEPTGNLDPENSAKVIKLLAHAAKERLVILITHEFSEAAEHVTRHIVIQEGQISMDMPLRPASEVKEKPAPKRQRQKLSPQIAVLQLRSRPVWSTLVLLFFALTAFAVFAFLGTFIVNLDDTSTRIYDNSAFLNGDMERIVVLRADGENFTQEDYDRLTAIEYVASLERYGYIADIQYAWQKDVDFYFDYNRHVIDGGMTDEDVIIMEEVFRMYDRAPYLQTVPALPAGQTFLSAGCLPQNLWEVVLCGDESRIGEVITVYLKDRKNWGADAYVMLNATVVGVTDLGKGLYFHDDIGRTLTTELLGGELGNLLFPCDDLTDQQVRISMSLYEKLVRLKNYSINVLNINLLDPDKDQWTSEYTVELSTPHAQYMYDFAEYQQAYKFYTKALTAWENNGSQGDPPEEPVKPVYDGPPYLHEQTHPGMLEVSSNMFYTLTLEGSPQVSIMIEDYAYTERAIEAIQGLGYLALSPYQLGSATRNVAKEEARMQTLTVCILALLAVVGLQIIVLRALYSAQTDSYRTLSSMGLTCGMAKRSVWWQILLLTVLGQILGFGAILLCENRGVERIVDLMRYLPPAQFAILSAVHLAASLVSALWIAHSVSRQVYPMARRESDMEFEEEEAAA